MQAFEFIIQEKSVSCASCNEVFAAPTNFAIPAMSKGLPVQADLHRVLPYGILRASMVTICPFCQYAWWTSTFMPHFYLPIGIAKAPSIDPPKKFAHAVFTGRKYNYHVLDRALLALNGYWCAKESHQETGKWMHLVVQELSAALADQSWEGNRARYHYILAEILRLLGRFDAAGQEFDLVDESAKLPADLVINQKRLAAAQNSDPVLLTNKQVETLFFPDFYSQIYQEIYESKAVAPVSADTDRTIPQSQLVPAKKKPLPASMMAVKNAANSFDAIAS